MITVSVNADQVVVALSRLTKDAMDKAWRRTLQKTAAWVKTRVTQELAKTTKIPRKALETKGKRKGTRLQVHLIEDGSSVKVWLGMNPIEAHLLAYGKGPTKSGAGVKSGKHIFPGAFLMPVYGTRNGQRYRVTRERKLRSGRTVVENKVVVMQRRGRARLPISKVKLSFEKDGATALQNASKTVAEVLMKKLRSEVRYELHLAAKNA